MSDKKIPKSRQDAVFSEDSSASIYSVNFDRHSAKIPHTFKNLPTSDKNSPTHHGPALAPTPGVVQRDETAVVNPISNAPELDTLEDAGIPDEYQFELYRLRRRVAELEAIVKDRDERVLRAIATLEDEAQFWRTGLHQHVWEKLGAVLRRVTRIDSTLSYLKDKESHHWPDLPIPERWRKK